MTQLLTATLVALCATGALAAGRITPGSDVTGSTFAAPWFCHDLDCPPYTIAAKYQADTIELRAYGASTWASTNVSDVSYDSAVRTGFYRLFAYISGANVKEQKIDMTAPVKVRCVAGAGPFCESHFIVSFMVPFALQSSPPTPSAKEVYIEEVPASKVYATAYGGWTSDTKVIERATELLAGLDNMGLKYDDSYFLSAGYDAPFRLLNRHNEIWVPAL